MLKDKKSSQTPDTDAAKKKKCPRRKGKNKNEISKDQQEQKYSRKGTKLKRKTKEQVQELKAFFAQHY